MASMRTLYLTLLVVICGVAPVFATPTPQRLTLPTGFTIDVYASGLDRPRVGAVAPNGDLFVTEIGAGQVSILRDRNQDGRADGRTVFASGLSEPHGLAFYRDWLYVGETNRIVRYAYRSGQSKAGQPEVVVPNLPEGGGHFTRTIAFGPDGLMYVSVGSSCNVCKEADERRATVLQFKPDGSSGKIYARGLRNAVGLRFDTLGRLWATSNGRDGLGDDVPPDELHILKAGLNAGWPFCHAGKYKDPQFSTLGSCSQVNPPDWNFQAHSAPLGVSEYTGKQFPNEYRGDLFVAFHGSWNRSVPTGYKLVRIHLENGRPTKISDFVTGWLQPNRSLIGRPVDVINAPDGSLYVTDDAEGAIYRIRYVGKS